MERKYSAGPIKAVSSGLKVVKTNDHTLMIQELWTVIVRDGARYDLRRSQAAAEKLLRFSHDVAAGPALKTHVSTKFFKNLFSPRAQAFQMYRLSKSPGFSPVMKI